MEEARGVARVVAPPGEGTVNTARCCAFVAGSWDRGTHRREGGGCCAAKRKGRVCE